MASPLYNAFSNIARSSQSRRSLSRETVANEMSSGSAPTTGTVSKIDTKRKSVMVTLSTGETVEYFLQNRYVLKDQSVAAIGFRAL